MLKKLRLTTLPILVFTIFSAFGQTTSQADQIKASYDLEKLSEIKSRFQKETKAVQQKISLLAQSRGIERKTFQKDGTLVDAHGIGEDGSLLYYQTFVSPSGKVTRADALYDNGLLDLGLSGEGMKVGVWDAGKALASHQEFDNRIQNTDQESEVDSHTTLVTGVIASSGIKQEAKGVAYSANVVTNDWRFDKNEVVDEVMNGLLISNHSYGIKTANVPDWYFGAYIQLSKNWDEIMYNAPYYLMVSAAGNAQNSNDNQAPISGKSSDGYDLLLGFATSKNGMVVTAANTTIDHEGNVDNLNLTAYSSFGPVDDGRIKPDLAGDGTSVYSTRSSNDQSYGSSMGTSMAAPGVSASLLLLQEYHQNLYGGFMKAATLKGLALHTADDVFEAGPDYKLGWGVMNTKAAAEFLQQKEYSTLVLEEELEEFSTYTLEVEANDGEDLMVSLSWTDPEAAETNQGVLNSTIAALVNDLDVRVTKNGTTFYPWKLNPAQAHAAATKGDNLVDPFERIEVPNASGTYTITVSHKNNLKFSKQDFSLLISGIKIGGCQLSIPQEPTISSTTNASSIIDWKGNEDTLYELQLKKDDDQKWTTHQLWENSFEMTELELGKKYQVRVRSVCTENLASDFSKELSFVFKGTDTNKAQAHSDDVSEENPLVLYPNPVVNEVSVATKTSSDAHYYVSDMSGFTVKQGKLQGAIDVSDLPTGLYVVNVFDLDASVSGKFIKK